MAIVVPYADINAHGSLAGSVSFRRQFGRVVFQKKPYPVQPNSSGQLAQRALFSTASTDWQSYDSQSKPYYQVRGPQLGMPGRSLYIGEHMKGNLPSFSVFTIRKFTGLQLLSPIGVGDYDLNWYFYAYYTAGYAWQLIGSIGDKKNVLENVTDFGYDHDGLRAYIVNTIQVPFRYGFSIQYTTMAGGPYSIVVRTPLLVPGSYYLYFSPEGSTWDDNSGTHLLATDRF